MPGLVPRLSGLNLAYAEAHLSLILDDLWRRMEQVVEGSAMHEVATNQSGKDGLTWNRFLGGLGKAQQQESDQRDGNLDTHGILGGADKRVIFRICLTQRKNSSMAQRRR